MAARGKQLCGNVIAMEQMRWTAIPLVVNTMAPTHLLGISLNKTSPEYYRSA
jgi:hypothetical protein